MTILTPDQRLRVFVSSTLRELADERAAAARAIRSLHLAPVMFELGARAHPPRNLYRAYIEQSHVFIGIYWQSYGWVAPDMEISGLQDEYDLAAELPKLIYVKRPAPESEPRLKSMLERIAADDVSYRAFSTAEELEGLVAADLATLLSEYFETSLERAGGEGSQPESSRLPTPPSRFIGRARELNDIEELLGRGEVRLVSLVGPGGIGKTRLAIETAGRHEGRFADGVRFVDLSSLQDANLFPSFLLDALGIGQNAPDPAAALQRWLADREMLLVLDNFEQLLDAAPQLVGILEAAPRVKILVTSRAVLRITGEHEYPVLPLGLPEDQTGRGPSDAMDLFVDRARRVRADVELTGETAPVFAAIVQRLDGLPLAIELGAARLKILPPSDLLGRLDSSLDFLTTGPRDLPERQRTLRAVIDWSYRLLGSEKDLFPLLAVFRGGATLDAIEAICAEDDPDVLDSVASLIEKSLLRHEVGASGEARFWLLETIREYAAELLDASGRADEIADRHASFYSELTADAQRGTAGGEQRMWFEKLTIEWPNIQVAIDHLLQRGEAKKVATMLWDLAFFMWVRGNMTDARKTAERILETPDIDEWTLASGLGVSGVAAFAQGAVGEAVPMLVQAGPLFATTGDRRGDALIQLVLGMVSPEMEGPEAAKERLQHSVDIFEDLGDIGWLSLSKGTYAWVAMVIDQHEGMTDMFEEAVDLSRQIGADLTLGLSLVNLSQHRMWQGRLDEAVDLQIQGLQLLRATDHLGTWVGFSVLEAARLLMELGENDGAARVLGLNHSLRERFNVIELGLIRTRREAAEEKLRTALGTDAFERALQEGRTLKVGDAIELVSKFAPTAAP